MPISSDQTRLSIDFGYEYTAIDGNVLQYQMKFMHTPTGPTVQISNGPYEPVELPADMFVEVAEFLISQGVVKGAALPKQTIGNRNLPLSLPSISKKRVADTPPAETISKEVEVEKPAPKLDFDPMALRIEARAKAKASKKVKKEHKIEDE